jgi:nicotinamidase-related amidase
LYVTGAEKDMERLAKMVERTHSRFNDIHVTLDSHHLMDLAHPPFWKDSKGNNPAPFTIITASDIESGRWTPVIPSLYQRMLAYTKGLEKGGRYPLCIWPPHCLIGDVGQSIVQELAVALKKFCALGNTIDYVTKGSNIFTEHYSAVKAEVPDPADPTTMVNTRFIKTLMDADLIAIAGEASSHCVSNSIRDIANEFKDDSYVKKIVFLEDCSSPVPGFENFETDFINEMKARGMRTEKAADFLA